MVYSNRVVSVPINERDGRVPMPLDNAVTSAVYKGNGFVIITMSCSLINHGSLLYSAPIFCRKKSWPYPLNSTKIVILPLMLHLQRDKRTEPHTVYLYRLLARSIIRLLLLLLLQED